MKCAEESDEEAENELSDGLHTVEDASSSEQLRFAVENVSLSKE